MPAFCLAVFVVVVVVVVINIICSVLYRVLYDVVQSIPSSIMTYYLWFERPIIRTVYTAHTHTGNRTNTNREMSLEHVSTSRIILRLCAHSI